MARPTKWRKIEHIPAIPYFIPTFQRILLSAREKIADSLVNGKMIHVEGGNFTRNICPVRCLECGDKWKESYENMELVKKGEYACPNCGSVHVECEGACKGKFCRNYCCVLEDSDC